VFQGRPVSVPHNLAFDWQFINYYFHRFVGRNPFDFSVRRLGDLDAGLVKEVHKATEWKKYRVTPHTHNPVDDARANAEAPRRSFIQIDRPEAHTCLVEPKKSPTGQTNPVAWAHNQSPFSTSDESARSWARLGASSSSFSKSNLEVL
jgi:hypothetical protein